MVVLARHGRTAYNAEGRFQGHLPVALDDLGRAQARELAGSAAARGAWAALWCSPLARALETARVVGAAIGRDPLADARFAETDAGTWTGRSFAEVRARDPEAFARWQAGDPGFAFPGGESFAAQLDRVRAGLADVRDGPLPALVVCHRGVIRLALADAGAGAARRDREVDNAALVPLPDGPGANR
jgi:broad specificity phosphatase PhoE